MAEPVKLHFNNGTFLWDAIRTPSVTVETTMEVWCQYCSHIFKEQDAIPANTRLVIQRCYQNLYGTFVEVKYNDITYSLKARNLNWIL